MPSTVGMNAMGMSETQEYKPIDMQSLTVRRQVAVDMPGMISPPSPERDVPPTLGESSMSPRLHAAARAGAAEVPG